LVPDISSHHSGLIVKGQLSTWTLWSLQMRPLHCLKMGTSYPLMQCHIPEWKKP